MNKQENEDITMALLDEILHANEEFTQNLPQTFPAVNKLPQRQLAIVTCMDTRLVDFLEPALGLRRGEVKIIKTAGNSVTSGFDDIIRSLLVCIYELGVKEIMVIGHHGCGMAHATSDSLITAMKQHGIKQDAIDKVKDELIKWVDEFHHPVQNVEHSVANIRNNPLIADDIPVHGLIFHPDTGKLDLIVNGYKK